MSTKISAQIIADSKNEFGQRLITYVLVFPRWILAELNTHRMFSRNSASSRAIPFKKMLERVKTDPFIPIAWQKDHSGMQGTEYFSTNATDSMADGFNTARSSTEVIESHWLTARDNAIEQAKWMNEKGVTKQICNRLLEPFLWHTAIVTATEYENFFALRCPQYHSPVDKDFLHRSKKDMYAAHSNEQNLDMMDGFDTVAWLKLNKGQGEIHIMALAEAMWDAQNESTPKQLSAGEWHIPFGDQMDIDRLSKAVDIWKCTQVEAQIKVATARCARVSYMNFDGTDDYEKDIALYDRLAASGHMSPFEHCAKAMSENEYDCWALDVPRNKEKANYLVDRQYGWCGNFRGFIQMRKMIPNENRT